VFVPFIPFVPSALGLTGVVGSAVVIVRRIAVEAVVVGEAGGGIIIAGLDAILPSYEVVGVDGDGVGAGTSLGEDVSVTHCTRLRTGSTSRAL
jgi:hypothetical protein